MRSSRFCFVLAVLATATLGIRHAAARDGGGAEKRNHHKKIRHVLLLSVDGLHAIDLANYVSTHPGSALAQLSGHGITYQQASTSKP